MERLNKNTLRFYTLPPNDVYYPFLLVNRKNYRCLFKRKFEHAILDSGVMDFARKDVADYPKGFLNRWINEARQLQKIFNNRVWIVIPDFPDDYNPGKFGNNVAKTLEVIKCYIQHTDVEWLPVIQSCYMNKFSFLESCQKLKYIILFSALFSSGREEYGKKKKSENVHS